MSRLIDLLKAAERERAALKQARARKSAERGAAANTEQRPEGHAASGAREREAAEADRRRAARARLEAEAKALAAAEARREAEQSRHWRPAVGALAAAIAFAAGTGFGVILTSGGGDTAAAGGHASAPEPLTLRLDADFEAFGRRTAHAADR